LDGAYWQEANDNFEILGDLQSALRIVWAEFDPSIFESMRPLLESEEFDLVTTHNGVEALQHFKSRPTDLIIADVQLPGMDGIELLRSVYESGLPTRFLATAHDVDYVDYLEIAQSMGALGALRKPFDDKEFLFEIAKCLSFEKKPLRETWPKIAS